MVPPAGELALRDERGHQTAAGRAIEDYARAAQGKDEFFDVDMYLVHVTGPQIPRRIPERPLTSAGNYRLELWRTDPEDPGTFPRPAARVSSSAPPSFRSATAGTGPTCPEAILASRPADAGRWR